jgi:hypothetical protein
LCTVATRAQGVGEERPGVNVAQAAGIDALSCAALHPGADDDARYASTGGAMNPNQPALIRAAIEKIEQGARLIIAPYNDPGAPWPIRSRP